MSQLKVNDLWICNISVLKFFNMLTLIEICWLQQFSCERVSIVCVELELTLTSPTTATQNETLKWRIDSLKEEKSHTINKSLESQIFHDVVASCGLRDGKDKSSWTWDKAWRQSENIWSTIITNSLLTMKLFVGFAFSNARFIFSPSQVSFVKTIRTFFFVPIKARNDQRRQQYNNQI